MANKKPPEILPTPPKKPDIPTKNPEEAPSRLIPEEPGIRQKPDEPILPLESPEIPEAPVEVPQEEKSQKI